MKAFAKGIKEGRKVKQGQIMGCGQLVYQLVHIYIMK